jgi:hypothetical protein
MILTDESYSQFDKKIVSYLTEEDVDFVDIGASDGVSESNTFLLAKQRAKGVSIEADAHKFNNMLQSYNGLDVTCLNLRITPENVENILLSTKIRKDFSFLSLDIDGYDFFVLDKLLSTFRPKLICAEINEKIPYPIKFSVLFSQSYSWKGDHFYGFSVAKAEEICKKHNYKLIDIDYHNIFLAPAESPLIEVDFQNAYETGYVKAKNRKEIFFYNSNVDHWHDIKDNYILMQEIKSFYKEYVGQYEIGV